MVNLSHSKFPVQRKAKKKSQQGKNQWKKPKEKTKKTKKNQDSHF